MSGFWLQFEKFNKYDQLNLSTRAGFICTGVAGTWSPQILGLSSSLWPRRFPHHSQRFGEAKRVTRRAPALGVIFSAGDTWAEYWLGSGLLILSFFFDFLMFGEIFREVLTIQKTGQLVKSQL